jgi:hypothetical protein
MLKKSHGNTWSVSGGSIRREFFFEQATPRTCAEYCDPKRWRLIWCPEGVRIGVTVRVSSDGSKVIWPVEAG